MAGPFLKLEPQPVSALIPVSWVTVSRVQNYSPNIIHQHRDNEEEKLLQPDLDPSVMHIYFADTLNEGPRLGFWRTTPARGEIQLNKQDQCRILVSCKM